ncbi:MAG: hypothetical protein FJX16_01125 [Alphaproteobacteria bacterium]|nr:hypothetical protein [Alphaproteobacteria bacterium]MBM3623925.1 hypothetical protein [Alphaproteobacteria bacterium]
MPQDIQFTGDFDVSTLPALIPGNWYIGFACKQCRQHFAILNEPTGAGGLKLSGRATFRATCPNCEASGDYSASELKQFQAAQGGPSSTA